MINNQGILYIATGNNYVEEAIFSAISCKTHNAYPIALITDKDDHYIPEDVFDHIIVKSATFSYRDKLLIRYSPFEQTVFLDTDTFICGSLTDLFRILDFRDFAIHQADEGFEHDLPELSSAMPEFNTGVIAFKLTQSVIDLIETWDKSFDTNLKIKTDQFHLRKALYESDVRFATFSSAYNFIIYHYNLVMQHVKVIHGRPLSALPLVAQDVNHIRHEAAWRRVYFPYNNEYGMIYHNLKNKDLFKLLRFHTRALLGNLLRQAKIKR